MSHEVVRLIVENNQLTYTGVFSKPALELWANGAKIFEGLLSSFASFGVKLPDI